MRHITLGIMLIAAAMAQAYRCDWSVVGIAGGEMASGEYRCVATAGQTAAGFMAGPDFWALIGYWLPEGRVGIEEGTKGSRDRVMATRLYSPLPIPFRTTVAIRYSLAADGPVTLAVHDIAGRVVRQLLASSVRRGAYRVAWNGMDNRGRSVADGVYFLKFTAGDHRQTEKLVLQR